MITPKQKKDWREHLRLYRDGSPLTDEKLFSQVCSEALPLLLDEVERLQKQVELSETHPLIAADIYKALGWQGGTIHQVVAEIKQLKSSLADYIKMAENQAGVFNAAVDWQETCSKKGRTHHDTDRASGYLYDRVRRYKQRQAAKGLLGAIYKAVGEKPPVATETPCPDCKGEGEQR